MKKLTTLLMMLCLGLFIVGCAGDDSGSAGGSNADGAAADDTTTMDAGSTDDAASGDDNDSGEYRLMMPRRLTAPSEVIPEHSTDR